MHARSTGVPEWPIRCVVEPAKRHTGWPSIEIDQGPAIFFTGVRPDDRSKRKRRATHARRNCSRGLPVPSAWPPESAVPMSESSLAPLHQTGKPANLLERLRARAACRGHEPTCRIGWPPAGLWNGIGETRLLSREEAIRGEAASIDREHARAASQATVRRLRPRSRSRSSRSGVRRARVARRTTVSGDSGDGDGPEPPPVASHLAGGQ